MTDYPHWTYARASTRSSNSGVGERPSVLLCLRVRSAHSCRWLSGATVGYRASERNHVPGAVYTRPRRFLAMGYLRAVHPEKGSRKRNTGWFSSLGFQTISRRRPAQPPLPFAAAIRCRHSLLIVARGWLRVNPYSIRAVQRVGSSPQRPFAVSRRARTDVFSPVHLDPWYRTHRC